MRSREESFARMGCVFYLKNIHAENNVEGVAWWLLPGTTLGAPLQQQRIGRSAFPLGPSANAATGLAKKRPTAPFALADDQFTAHASATLIVERGADPCFTEPGSFQLLQLSGWPVAFKRPQFPATAEVLSPRRPRLHRRPSPFRTCPATSSASAARTASGKKTASGDRCSAPPAVKCAKKRQTPAFTLAVSALNAHALTTESHKEGTLPCSRKPGSSQQSQLFPSPVASKPTFSAAPLALPLAPWSAPKSVLARPKAHLPVQLARCCSTMPGSRVSRADPCCAPRARHTSSNRRRGFAPAAVLRSKDPCNV